MTIDEPPKDENEAGAEDAAAEAGADTPAEEAAETPADGGGESGGGRAESPASDRFSSGEDGPPADEATPKERNLKDKQTMANLADELDDFGDLYDNDESSGKKRKKKKRKKKKKINPIEAHKGKLIFLCVLGILGYGYYVLSQPRVGSIGFGMCKVFLEKWVEFPAELRISTVTEFKDSVRIWYVQTDSFGQYRMEPIRCYYANTPEKGFHMEKIEINRKDLDREIVDGFNRSMPAILMTEEYLHIPPPLPNKLQSMQMDFYSGRL